MKGVAWRHRAGIVIGLALLLAAAGRCAAAENISTVSGAASTSTDQGVEGGSFYSPLPEKAQEDLGNIRPVVAASLLSYLHGQATVNTEYTSNAPLYHSRDAADFLIAPEFEGGFSAPLNKYFKVNVEARVEDYTYASHQSLGFWGFSGETNLEYRYKPVWPRIYAGTEPYYYFSYATGNRLTTAIGPVVGVDQTLSIDRGKTLLLMGYHFGEYYSSPGIDTRQSHTAMLALTQQIRRDLYAQLYWEFQYSIYSTADRDELRNIVGLSLIHQFTPQTFMSVYVNYVDNASNSSVAKYTSVNSGVSLVWQY